MGDASGSPPTDEKAMTESKLETLSEGSLAGRPADSWANGLPAHPLRL
jgi:hypothetical protein